MVKKVDHIGIAVKNLDEALNFYENILGLKSAGTETGGGNHCFHLRLALRKQGL